VWEHILLFVSVQGDLAALAVAMDGLRERWVVKNYIRTKRIKNINI
jgi:hypothetical protein